MPFGRFLDSIDRDFFARIEALLELSFIIRKCVLFFLDFVNMLLELLD